MATLSKTTTNYAERRNIELWVDGDMVHFMHFDEDGHIEMADLVYNIQDGGFFFDHKNFDELEDLPQWVQDEKHLRLVVDYVATTISESNTHWSKVY